MITKKVFCFHFSTLKKNNFARTPISTGSYILHSNLLRLQNRASASMIAPPEYDVAPIAAPVLPHPVRPRRRDRRQNNPCVLNHPQNLQPRGI